MCRKQCTLGYKSAINLPQSDIVLVLEFPLKSSISQQVLDGQLAEVKVAINRCNNNRQRHVSLLLLAHITQQGSTQAYGQNSMA